MNFMSVSADAESTFTIGAEQNGEGRARNALLDRVMAPNWRKKSSNALRRGYMPSRGLTLVARNEFGSLIGTVRLWDVASENGKLGLLLGPLAVDDASKSSGVGSALMKAAISKAAELGHGAILLVGDAAYYERFGFSAGLTQQLSMPGPYEQDRFLGLELQKDALAGAAGVLVPSGRKLIANQHKNQLVG
ncbi:GNAT family N-acetyltransferase [Ahrensia sp. 13_GOM-1096m]|uniref:GNAT family N-acetyltransferase n=1 Tax=Ahrensia sp. 13_GOM-1096m TaxID=1380380 RepID=UPI00047D942F|nr:N-acetyltransferase [Ahrensia sp. 13_GOM-1096m]